MWCVFPCRLFLGAGRLTLAITFGFDISPDRWQIHTMSLLILKADIHERGRQVSALGQKRTFAVQNGMSALPPIADMCSAQARCPLCAKSGHHAIVPSQLVLSSRDFLPISASTSSICLKISLRPTSSNVSDNCCRSWRSFSAWRCSLIVSAGHVIALYSCPPASNPTHRAPSLRQMTCDEQEKAIATELRPRLLQSTERE